eukprot:1497340-Rhodomonas_salina.3
MSPRPRHGRTNCRSLAGLKDLGSRACDLGSRVQGFVTPPHSHRLSASAEERVIRDSQTDTPNPNPNPYLALFIER